MQSDYAVSHLQTEIERGEDAISEFQELLERGAEHLAAASADVRYGLRSPASFMATLEREEARLADAQEVMGVIEIRLDRALTEIEHARLTQQLRSIASRVGEEIGRTERGGYAVMIPWASAQELAQVSEVLENATVQIVADAEVEIGAVLTASAQITPELHAVSRTYGVTLSHQR